MSLTDKQMKEVDYYLDGDLDNEALKRFEIELKQNKDLQEYVSVSKQMQLNYNNKEWDYIKGSKSDKIDELEQYLNSDEAKEINSVIQEVSGKYLYEAKSTKALKRLYPYIVMAASIIILVGYFTINASQTNQDLYEQNNDWGNLPSLLSRGNSEDQLLIDGENAFLDKDYQLAKENFNVFAESNSEISPTVMLYLGISQLETNDYNLALKTFDGIINRNTIDKSKGYWYKSLVYLKMNDKKSAIEQLKIILSNTDNYKYNEAAKLLKELD